MSYTILHGKLVSNKVKGRAVSVVPKDPGFPKDKGEKGGSCNCRSCLRPGANYYNKSTQKYYCARCAEEINWPGGRADCMALYGVPLLCELEE